MKIITSLFICFLFVTSTDALDKNTKQEIESYLKTIQGKVYKTRIYVVKFVRENALDENPTQIRIDGVVRYKIHSTRETTGIVVRDIDDNYIKSDYPRSLMNYLNQMFVWKDAYNVVFPIGTEIRVEKMSLKIKQRKDKFGDDIDWFYIEIGMLVLEDPFIQDRPKVTINLGSEEEFTFTDVKRLTEVVIEKVE